MSLDCEEIDELYKKLIIKYLFLIVGVFFLFFIYYEWEGIAPMNTLMLIATIVHIFLCYIPYKLKYSSLKLLIPGYLFFISLFMYPIVILFWKSGEVTAFIWYLIVPLGAMVFFSVRTFVSWSIFVLVLACSVFVVSPFFHDDFILNLTNVQHTIINIMTIVFSLFLVFYFLFYLNKVNNLKILAIKQNEIISYEANDKEEEVDNEKFIELYNNILTYFEKKKPYCNPDFTISQLAIALHTNVTYISKAIKIGKDTNFNIFINTYRVNMIKEMLEKDIQHKYTIRHIYISAGFRHQSTFNKVFKQIEGVTPSDYIKNMGNKEERE